jgi:hypothetical protein
MLNFYQLHEKLLNESLDSDDELLDIIQAGYNLDENFWNNFLSMLNNSSGLSQLLDLPTYKISSWRGKITKALEKFKKIRNNEEKNKKNKILRTGDL